MWRLSLKICTTETWKIYGTVSLINAFKHDSLHIVLEHIHQVVVVLYGSERLTVSTLNQTYKISVEMQKKKYKTIKILKKI